MKDVGIGFDGGREINRVRYDPSEISVEQMEQALMRAGTYTGTKE